MGNFVYDPQAEKNADRAFEPGTAVNYEVQVFLSGHRACDAHIRFSFVTGVSKFTKVSLFSELDNLDDITIDPQHATLCGYTDENIDTVFAPELEELDRGGLVFYRLGYPNREVRSSLNRSLLQAVGWDEARSRAAANRLYDALAAADLPGLEAHLRSLFAGILYNWHVNNPIAHYEGYYASVV